MGRRNKMQETQQVVSTPWPESQPYLKDIMQEAQGAYDAGAGQQYWPGETYVPMGPAGEQALQKFESIANQGNPNLPQAQGALGQILTSGPPSTMGDYRALLADAEAGNPELGYLRPTAEGAYLGEPNPFLADMYSSAADDITNRLKTMAVASGRYGNNNWMTGAFGDSLGGLYSSMYVPAYEAERDRLLSASGLLAQYGQTDIANRLGILGAMTNAEQQGIQNKLNATSLLPSLDAMRYSDAERLAQVAGARQANAQSMLDADIARFDFEQNAPWLGIANYQSAISGLPSGQTTTTYEPPPSRIGGLLGGASSGFNIGASLGFPLLGAAIGGGLGFFA